jgi:putative transposase
MVIRMPPQYSVAEVVGSLKGKSAIAVARQCGGRKRNVNGEALWARGYAVSTVGCEEDQSRQYIQHQEQRDGQGDDEDGDFEDLPCPLTGSPWGCSHPSSLPLCGSVMTPLGSLAPSPPRSCG